MENQARTFKYIDTKKMTGNLTSDELNIAIVALVVVLFFGGLLFKICGAICGYFLIKGYSRFKQLAANGFLTHLAYSAGFKSAKGVIPSHKRYFLGA